MLADLIDISRSQYEGAGKSHGDSDPSLPGRLARWSHNLYRHSGNFPLSHRGLAVFALNTPNTH